MYELLIPKSNKLILAKSEAIDIFSDGQEQQQEITSLPEISIVHPVALFQLSDDSTCKELPQVIVLDIIQNNNYWKSPMDESGGKHEPPDCSSEDGITPDNGQSHPQSATCASCHKNQPGSGDKGAKSRACKNMKKLTLLCGAPLPCTLYAPPTSLWSLAEYLQKLQMFKQGDKYLSLPYQAGVCAISLMKKDTYSVLQFNLKSAITDMAYLQQLAEYRKSLLPIIHKKPASASAPAPAPDNEEEIPF